ncbi:MAG: hypothetical protein ACQEQ0_13830 [Bacteroidota bacterium]
MAVITDETVTTFYYKINAVIDRIQLGVLYKVRKRDDILGLDGNSVIDVELLVKEYMSSVAHDIFSKWLSPLARELSDLEEPQEPFEYDETFTHPETEEETENCIIYRVIFPEKFDTTTKQPIYKAIEDMIVSYCIWQWLMDSNIQGWEKYEMEYERKKDALVDLVTRRKNLRITYRDIIK